MNSLFANGIFYKRDLEPYHHSMFGNHNYQSLCIAGYAHTSALNQREEMTRDKRLIAIQDHEKTDVFEIHERTRICHFEILHTKRSEIST